MNTGNSHIGHQYLEKPIMLGVRTPYWIHHKFKSQKCPRTCWIIIQGESQPIGNDLGHPWKVCAFQSLPCDLHIHICIHLSTLFEPNANFIIKVT